MSSLLASITSAKHLPLPSLVPNASVSRTLDQFRHSVPLYSPRLHLIYSGRVSCPMDSAALALAHLVPSIRCLRNTTTGFPPVAPPLPQRSRTPPKNRLIVSRMPSPLAYRPRGSSVYSFVSAYSFVPPHFLYKPTSFAIAFHCDLLLNLASPSDFNFTILTVCRKIPRVLDIRRRFDLDNTARRWDARCADPARARWLPTDDT
ncbi:hypothetical protein DFP72DRAFT_184037 [Ephemerocybe angulata]|uniref:Uncharacterized protein n=1 Tax=Ephemerocybe angulata TaxID=980116 RepID=A0A8H6LV70_9AGAR|nr:hypothetical protein DFP72DRAFT_184037 [Tulosesus angulatus]